ncbi:MAG TPA: ABC transporter permease [Candidatus Acidoferrum sp.]|nr:ABC transporter permease [Candidatus Acidoferrum sp.]
MRNLFSDLQLGFRILLRNPGFAVTAILLLALGIGANTAIFSVVNAVLLRPLPYQDSSRIMQIWHVPPAKSFPGMTLFSVSPANYLDWQTQNHSFEGMSAYGGARYNVGGKERPEAIQAATVAPSFFSILRVQPLLGRGFTPDDDRPGQGHVVVLGNALWRERYGADPAVVGQKIVLDGETYSVIGVMPRTFKFPSWAQLWTPLAWTDQTRAVRGNHNYQVIGRLKPRVDIRAAQAELSAISARLEQLYPEDDRGWGAKILTLREQTVGDVRPALLVLLGAVGFVLLIACANVANLVLGKILARKKEIAIRSALGATRGAILRLVLTETLLLSLAGGALGLLLARFGTTLIVKFLADRLPRFADITLNAPVLAFTAFLALFAGALAGLLPALRFTKTDINEALKQGQSRGSSDSGGSRTRGLLVVSEVALSLVLLIGAGLMVRTLWQLSNVKPGFDPNGLLTMTVSIPANKFPTSAAYISFFERVLQQVRATPGVESAGVIDDLPMGDGGSHQPVAIEGQPVVPMADQPEVDVRLISPGYLSSMRVPLLSGRDLTDGDVAGRNPAVIISESMAKRFWPNENPLGKHLTLTFYPGVSREIVGVVGDVKLDSLDETRPTETIYWPLNQIFAPPSEPWRSFPMSLAVRASIDPMSAVSAVTAAVHQVDPETPVTEVLSMNELISNSLSPQRSNMLLLAAFAGLALVLTAVGIYSVLSYAVRRRVREIGIRMALGASHSDVLKMVLTDGLKPILLGIIIGFAVALALGRVVSSLIFGVRPTDPLTFVAVASLLVAVGVLATIVPAYRATRVEPVRTLRDE